jgi:dihydroflavonol-4-reductase
MILKPSAANRSTTVLVTGGSGLIGSHCVAKLLKLGYQVRTTVRSASREKAVVEMMKNAKLVDEISRLSFFQADLTGDKGWYEATAGCDYVLHVASPFPVENPPHEDDLIIPAREGSLRALRFARDAKVKRVVITSSIVAITFGVDHRDHVFTERDWSDLSLASDQSYVKSKTLAEKAAWDFVEEEGQGLELAVINPTGVLGPILGPCASSSIGIIASLLSGRMARGAPNLMFGVVDVRDIADLHIRAMVTPEANGERFLATNKVMTVLEISEIIKEYHPNYENKLPSQVIPSWMVWLASWISSQAKMLYPQLGIRRTSDNSKAKRILDWEPIPIEKTIADTIEPLEQYGNKGSV